MAVDAHAADTELDELACDEPRTEAAHVDDIDDSHTETTSALAPVACWLLSCNPPEAIVAVGRWRS